MISISIYEYITGLKLTSIILRIFKPWMSPANFSDAEQRRYSQHRPGQNLAPTTILAILSHSFSFIQLMTFSKLRPDITG